MRKIWKFLLHHIRSDFKTADYTATALLLIIAIILNYRFDIEDGFLDQQEGIAKFFLYYLFYAVPYYLTLRFHKNETLDSYWNKKTFWIRSQLALLVLSLDSSVPFLSEFIYSNFDDAIIYWTYKVFVNLISIGTVFLPLILFYLLYDRPTHTHVYGLNARKFDVKPYFVMLLIMMPLLLSASFHPSFIRQYPMYKTSEAHLYLEVPEYITVMIYELAYGLDFVTVEFLFRGFMVIGLMHVVGRRAVLAMAVVYCFLHFGKPAGEAISSIFGGYILGVIAFETRSIWGGIIVHLGIAWMMEIIGFVQRQLQ